MLFLLGGRWTICVVGVWYAGIGSKIRFGSCGTTFDVSCPGLSRETGNGEIADSGHFWQLLGLCYLGDVCDLSPYVCALHACDALWRLVWS